MLLRIHILADNPDAFQPKALFMLYRSLSMDIMNYGLREKYEQLKKFGDRLSDMKEVFRKYPHQVWIGFLLLLIATF